MIVSRHVLVLQVAIVTFDILNFDIFIKLFVKDGLVLIKNYRMNLKLI